MLYMTVWAIKHRTFVNNFAYETAEINIEVKHLRDKNRYLPSFYDTLIIYFCKVRYYGKNMKYSTNRLDNKQKKDYIYFRYGKNY